MRLHIVGHEGNSKGVVEKIVSLSVTGSGDTTKPTVNSFTATTPVNSNVNMPITAFTASDNTAVTGYLITESATPPAAGAAGWTGTAPTTYTAAAGDGTKTLYPWAKDAAGNVSLVYATPVSVVVDGTGPTDGTLTVTPGNTQNGLSWTAASDAGVGLRTGTIYDVRFLTGATPPSCATGTSLYAGDNLTYTHTTLTNGQPYSYRVCAYDTLNNASAGAPGSGTPTAGATAPTLASPTATTIDTTTATLGANITSDGGASITARGTVWGTTAAPTGNQVAEGGTATGVFTQARSVLTAGTKIYYRGYATNSAGTAYSPDGSFYTEPATQASAVTFLSVTGSSMTVNWTRGSGSEVIVLIHEGAAVDADPVDGSYTTYTASADFGAPGTQIGTGNYVLYKGTGTSVAVTGLSASTTYHVKAYELAGNVDTAGVNQGANYRQTTPATGSQATTAAANVAPTVTGALAQYQSNGVTVLASGGSATSNAVVVEAQVNDADGDKVIIEVDIDSNGSVDCASPAVTASGTLKASCTALADASYDWRVRAKDDQGNTSGWTAFTGTPDFTVSLGIDIGIDTTPPTESGLAVSPGDTVIELAWNVADDGSGSGLDPVNTYKIVSSTSATPVDCSGAGIYTGNMNSYSDTGLSNGTTYYYLVCAYDNVGNVSPGQAISATPGSSCSYSPPTVSILDADAEITNDGGFIDYTIRVTNGDVGACAATAFDIAVVDGNTSAFYPTAIATDPLSVPAGSVVQTSIRVTAKANQSNGTSNAVYFYTAADGNHAQSSNSNIRTTTINVTGGGCLATGSYLNANGDQMTTSR